MTAMTATARHVRAAVYRWLLTEGQAPTVPVMASRLDLPEAEVTSWFANCVWDGLSILALVGDGALETHSPATGQPIRFAVRDRIVAGEGVVHFLVPAARFWDDIGFT
jgi:hypothetical protein